MAHSTRPDRRVQAQAAVDRAMEGDLIQLRSYSIIDGNGRNLIGIPPEVFMNLAVSKGDEPPAYLDTQNECLVYHLGSCLPDGGEDDGSEC